MFLPYSYCLFFFAGIFFAASGAVNYHSMIKGGSAKDYLQKRMLGLVIPYFLFCFLTLIVFIAQHITIPNISLRAIILWAIVRPPPEITPFPVFQLWFLRTLIYIILISPLLFMFIRKCKTGSFVYITFIMLLSILELPEKPSKIVLWLGTDPYRILFFSAFFLIGALFFSNAKLLKRNTLIAFIVISFALSIITANTTADIASHFSVHLPDFCYASASFCSLVVFIIFRQFLVTIINSNKPLLFWIELLNQYSLGILLYHTLAIQIFEGVFTGPITSIPPVLYGIVKLFGTFALTFLIAIPTTIISNKLFLKMRLP